MSDTPVPTLTRAIARWIHALRPESVGPQRLHRARIAMLDFLGCALAGSTLPEAREACVLARPGDVRVPGREAGMDLPSALIAWGAMGALLQWHDGYGRGGNHPSSSILPVLLAQSDDWPRLVMPMVVGYEVANRLAASTHPHQTLAGSAPTSSMGAIGAAAALCRWQGLDEDTTARALGLAGFWAPIAAFEGLRARGSGVPLHSGLAARAGWEAVQAARAGLDASDTLLEGDGGAGLLRLLGGADASARAVDPSTWSGETLDQVYLKPFPGCRHVHPAVEAALGLRERLPPDPADWARVDIRTYALAVSFGAPPRAQATLYDCLMSLPWCVALALLEGTPGVAQVRSGRDRPVLAALAGRVACHPDPAHQAAYPAALGATVTVTDTRGVEHSLSAVLRYSEASALYSPRGPFGPVLDEAGVIEKFVGLSAALGDEADRRALARRILQADPAG